MRANVGVKFISREEVVSNEVRKARSEMRANVGVKFISREGALQLAARISVLASCYSRFTLAVGGIFSLVGNKTV